MEKTLPQSEEKQPVKKGSAIASRSFVDDDQIQESESLVIDGVDISGRWNTFINPRVDYDFNRSLFYEIKAMRTGRYVNRCWQCGNCTAVCTVVPYFPDFNPRLFIYLIQTGNMAQLKKRASAVWRCVGCYKCTQRCPKDVNPAEVMEALGVVVKKYFPDKAPKFATDVTRDYANQIIDGGLLNMPTLHAKSLQRAGRFNDLFQKEEMNAAIKVVFSSRIFYIIGLILGIARPSGWGKIRRVLRDHMAKNKLEVAR